MGSAVYEPSGIHDSKEVIGYANRHPLFLSLQYQETEGQEVAEEEKETRYDKKDKGRFPERMDKLHDLKWFFCMREAGFCSSYGNDHHTEKHEGNGPHRPSETNLWNESGKNNRQDDSS